jgi:catechol 2,3-dioxygenase
MAAPSLDPRTTVGHVHLRVADLDRALGFYRNVLGFREAWRGGETVMLSADGSYPFAIGLTATGDPPAPSRRCGLYHAAFLLPDRGALGRLLRRLVEHDIALDGASDHLVSEALYLRDPEGNGLELYADRPKTRWSWHGGQVDMTTRELDLHGLLADGGDRAAPVPEGTRLGHVHLRVSDLGRAERFYHEALGFDVTLRRYSGALFMSAGGYHHHLGTNVWAGQGIPPAADTGPGLWYFTVRLPDPANLTAAAARVAANGIAAGDAADCGAYTGIAVRDLDNILVVLASDRTGRPDRPSWTPASDPLGAVRAT